MTRRMPRVNSLLKEVISQVIMRDVNNPDVSQFTTVTSVETSKDLRHAKVFVSIIGTEEEKKRTLEALNVAAGFIAIHSSKQVTMRYFPELTFKIDNSVETQMHINALIDKVQQERQVREGDGRDPTH